MSFACSSSSAACIWKVSLPTRPPKALLRLHPTARWRCTFSISGRATAHCLFCGEETMLIDGGKIKNNQKLISRLKELNVTHLDAVICSHPDEDHCGGLAAVLAGTETDAFCCSVDSWHTKAFSDVVKYADEQGVCVTIPSPGDSFSFGGANVEFLGPVQDYGDDPNEGSLVARVRYGETSFLFTGDMGFEAEDDMLAANVDVSATVLKVAHHGSAGSSSSEFLEAVDPQYAVISVGADNDYGRPARPRSTDWPRLTFRSTGRTFSARSRQVPTEKPSR
ncbi:MAG: ComEC/Rec2 family competence protein [Oscillospiraceae bacterium]